MKVNKCPKADRCAHAEGCMNHDTFRGEYLCFDNRFNQYEYSCEKRRNLEYNFTRIVDGVVVYFKITNNRCLARSPEKYGHDRWVHISRKEYESYRRMKP